MDQNDKVQEIQIHLIPKTSTTYSSQDAIKINRQLSRVQKKEVQDDIAIDAVMKIFNQMNNSEDANDDIHIKKLQKKLINKKSNSSTGGQIKREGRSFNSLSEKILLNIENYVSRFRTYLSSNGRIFDSKTGNFNVQLFRYVMIGIFQLRALLKQSNNDLSSRQKNIAAQDTDVFEWNRRIVEQFDKQFKKAQFQKKLGTDLKKKWEILLTHCKDQNNESLRRGLANRNCNAKKVINMTQDQLMSAQKKKERDRQLKNILLQSQIDFEKQNDIEMMHRSQFEKNLEEGQMTPQEDIPTLANQSLTNIQHYQSPSSKKQESQKPILTEKQKEKQNIMEYIYIANIGSLQRLNNRIMEDLKNTQSFKKIYKDYKKVFFSHKNLKKIQKQQCKQL